MGSVTLKATEVSFWGSGGSQSAFAWTFCKAAAATWVDPEPAGRNATVDPFTSAAANRARTPLEMPPENDLTWTTQRGAEAADPGAAADRPMAAARSTNANDERSTLAMSTPPSTASQGSGRTEAYPEEGRRREATVGRPPTSRSGVRSGEVCRKEAAMPVRTADAQGEGSLEDGKGTMRFSGWEGSYSFVSRCEAGPRTNPEELIAAAHAGCYSMALAGGLSKAGHVPDSVHTTAKVHIDKGEAGFRITRIELQTEARVSGIDEGTFQEIAEAAKEGCPVSQALEAVPIELTAKLVA